MFSISVCKFPRYCLFIVRPKICDPVGLSDRSICIEQSFTEIVQRGAAMEVLAVLDLSGELLKMMTGINMVRVPYRGAAPALTELLAGRCRWCSSIRHRSSTSELTTLRTLAVTNTMLGRAVGFPTMGEPR